MTPVTNGTAWVGLFLRDGPLYYFDGEQWGGFAGSAQIQADEAVAPDGAVWLGTDSGVSRFDGKT